MSRKEILIKLATGDMCGLTRDEILDDVEYAEVWCNYNMEQAREWNKEWRKINSSGSHWR